MKKTKFIAGLAMGLFCSSAFAVDSWEGDKFIYSTSDKYNLAYKIKINGDKATVLSYGQSNGTVTAEDEKVIIQLEPGSMKSNSFPFKLNPVTGVEEQIYTEQTTEKIILSGKKKNLRMRFIGTDCFDYDNDGATEVCESSDSKLGKKFKLVLKSKLKKITTDVPEGSSVTLPIADFDSAFVTVGANGAATSAQDGILSNDKIKKIVKDGKKVIATLSDGSTISYGQIGKDNGISRVVGIQKSGDQESLVMGMMAVDLKPALSREELLGTYTPVNDKSVSYTFNDDGLGMFTTSDPVTGEKLNNPWIWEFTNGELEARRYRHIDGQYPVSSEEMLACIALGEEQCVMFNRRSYKVLSKKDNIFVLLRKFEFVRPDVEPTPVKQTVQIMKLKKN
jgi:hypothetical protein